VPICASQAGCGAAPRGRRLSVYKSLRFIYAQLIDDDKA